MMRLLRFLPNHLASSNTYFVLQDNELYKTSQIVLNPSSNA